VLGVSVDSEADNRAFAEKYSFPYKLLCDTDGALSVAYGAADSPSAGRAKRISYLIGPDGTIERAWSKVDAAAHADDVLSALGD
jgi:thioredoxin-dependent peroxiredoxin